MTFLRRWGVLLALILSVGVNLGVMLVLWVRLPGRQEPPLLPPPGDPLAVEVAPWEPPPPAGRAPAPPGVEPREADTAEPPPGPGVAEDRPVRTGPAARPEPEPPAAGPPGRGEGPAGEGTVWPGPPGPEPKFEFMARTLGLAGERAEQFVAIQRRSWQRAQPLRAELERTRAELGAELASGRAHRPRIEELGQRMRRAQEGLDQTLVDMLLATQSVLTMEEQQRFARFALHRLRPGAPGGPPVFQRPQGPVRRMLDRRREGLGRPGRPMHPGGRPDPRPEGPPPGGD